MSDPVASKSGFLCMYMTNHPDTLVAYVKHFGKVTGNVRSAQMKSIDTKGINLSYTLKSGDVGSVHVKFDPPLVGYEEVKPRLLSMKADAQEALGMLQSPKITSFRLTSRAIQVGCMMLTAVYFGWAPPQGTSLLSIPADVSDIVFAPAHTISNLIGFHGFQSTIKIAFQIGFAAHGLESLYTFYLCRQYVKGTFVTVAYVFATLACGFPVWNDLKKRVQEKRIESVMKAE